jgi:D-glycero-D-manno-heptose 1,7-bisphosphate phosphatase
VRGLSRRAAFLDRDGTIIEDRHYIADPAAVRLLPGASDGLRALRAAGYALVVVTNQSGIARGLYDDAAFHAVQRRVEELLAGAGVHLAGVYYCPHHPAYTGACSCRKPATGLYEQAADELDLSLAKSIYAGDRARDVLPALALGGQGFLVGTGHDPAELAALPPEVRVVADLRELARAVAG